MAMDVTDSEISALAVLLKAESLRIAGYLA
jgi:hypothetical protein